MNNNEYIKRSLELHLFFDRIMKEHALFLEASFLDKDKDLKAVASNYQKQFNNILNEAVSLSNNNITSEYISSGEMFTKYTLDAENKTARLSGINIDTNLTVKELSLNANVPSSNIILINRISSLNRRTMPLINNIISFKEGILDKVLKCNLFTNNYPLLITHITNEARMYQRLLTRIEARQEFNEKYIYEQELFWNDIMKEHSEFIRGLLDPTETSLIETADKYAKEYEDILEKYRNNINMLHQLSIRKTTEFRKFKIAGLDGILNCKIKSVIIPLLADHVLREANHFLRILRGSNEEII